MPETTSNNDIVEVLRAIDGGRFLGSVSDKLDQLARQLAESARGSGGKPKGKLTLAINFKLDGGILEISGDVKMTEPATVHGRAIRFLTADGTLVREDPRQKDQIGLALSAPVQGTPVRDGTPDFRRAAAGDRD